MSDGDTVTQLAIVVLLLGLAVPGLTTAYDYAGTPIEYEESATVDFGNTTTVQNDTTVEDYSDEVTVWTDSGDRLYQNSDFQWDAETGEVTWIDTKNTTDGETATITYGAHQRTQQTETAWTVLTGLFSVFGIFAFVSTIKVLWSYIGEVFE